MNMFALDSERPLQVPEEENMTEAKKELELWRGKVSMEDDVKSRLILKKLDDEEQKKKNNKLMMDLIQKRHELELETSQNIRTLQDQVMKLRKNKMELTEKLKRKRSELHQQKEEAQRLEHKFKIWAELPEVEVEFVKPKPEVDDDVTSDRPIRGQFLVCQEGALQLTAGQALITFEEERVAAQIQATGRCSVSIDDQVQEVKPKRIRTEPLVQFEVQLLVSRSQLDVSDIVTSMAKDRVEDRLELAFCRPSHGGAEVRNVAFNQNQSSAKVSFKRAGVVEGFALKGEHSVDLDFQTVVKVSPVYEAQLHKFQSFCGVLKRSLLLDGVRDSGDEEEVQDHLEIHFQKPSNGGGEIEHTLYTSSRVQAFLCPDL